MFYFLPQLGVDPNISGICADGVSRTPFELAKTVGANRIAKRLAKEIDQDFDLEDQMEVDVAEVDDEMDCQEFKFDVLEDAKKMLKKLEEEAAKEDQKLKEKKVSIVLYAYMLQFISQLLGHLQ